MTYLELDGPGLSGIWGFGTFDWFWYGKNGIFSKFVLCQNENDPPSS